MKGIILAAGVGKRLSLITHQRPKCLIPFGNRTLLARYLDTLSSQGIRQIAIVVGYQQELIREEIEPYRGQLNIRLIENPDYRRGSVGSLWAARSELDDDAVIMDADVLFHPDLLTRLLFSPHPNALLMDETIGQTTEECMVAVQRERVVALSKQLPKEYDLAGEGVGFLKVSKQDAPKLVQAVGQCVDQGCLDMEYEDALKEFFGEVPVGVEKIGGLPWIEIDFPEDVDRATQEVLPRLT